MKRILITGGSGFIAHSVRDDLLSRFGERYTCDLLSLRGEAWKETDFSRYDCVLHTAGIAHVSARNVADEEYFAVNRDLALTCARAAKAGGARQFIYLSSIIVYGEAGRAGQTRLITPDTLPAPANAYGLSKLEAEERILPLADEHFAVAVLRLPVVYGRGCKGNYRLLGKWVGRIPFFPALCGKRSVLYVKNLSELIRLSVDQHVSGRFYPQDEKPLGAAELATYIAAARGKKLHLTRAFNPLLRLMGGCSIVRRALGGISYEANMSDFPGDYRRYDTQSGIREIETDGGK